MESLNNDTEQNTEKFDNAHIAELSKMTKENRDTLKLQEEEDEAIAMGNKRREDSAKRMREQSKRKEAIEVEKGQKLIARRAFIKGALVSTGVIATAAVGIEATLTINKKVSEAESMAAQEAAEKAEKQAAIDAVYQTIAPELLDMLDKSSVNKFKATLSGTAIESYSEYLLYRLIEENKLYNYSNHFVDANECLAEINAIKIKVIDDAARNKDLYEGFNVPVHSDNDEENRYNTGKVSKGAIDQYLDAQIDAEAFSEDVDTYQVEQEQQQTDEIEQEKGASR